MTLECLFAVAILSITSLGIIMKRWDVGSKYNGVSKVADYAAGYLLWYCVILTALWILRNIIDYLIH